MTNFWSEMEKCMVKNDRKLMILCGPGLSSCRSEHRTSHSDQLKWFLIELEMLRVLRFVCLFDSIWSYLKLFPEVNRRIKNRYRESVCSSTARERAEGGRIKFSFTVIHFRLLSLSGNGIVLHVHTIRSIRMGDVGCWRIEIFIFCFSVVVIHHHFLSSKFMQLIELTILS